MLKIKLLCVLLAVATPAFAQNYPLPASVNESPAICTNCPGTNASSQSNSGLPTYPYDAPLDFTGRFLDSTSVATYQHASGMRTLRARAMQVVPEQNRVYIQLGEMVAAYDLDTFFTGTLTEPLVRVDSINTGTSYTRPGGVYEKLSSPDAFFYPEAATSGWDIDGAPDIQRTLSSWDVDDRGYLYAAASVFGWGIQQDDGRTDGTHMPFVHRDSGQGFSFIFAFRNGSTYYAVGSTFPNTTKVYDVTNPAAPVFLGGRSTRYSAVAKDEATGRIAVIDNQNRLRVYSAAGLVSNAAPLVEYTASIGQALTDVTFDDSGNLWAVEGGNGTPVLWKISASTLARATFDVYGSVFSAVKIHATAGYVAVLGLDAEAYGVRLFNASSGTPVQVGIDDFFRKYYFRSPTGYAQPYIYSEPAGVRLVKQGTNTYLMIGAGALGDAYEIPILATSVTGLFPASGPPAGGTAVTIEGVNLDKGTPGVTFGGVNATSVTVTNGRIVAVSPAHAAGTVDVVVSYTGELPMTVPQQFTYMLAVPQNFVATGNPTNVTLSWSAVTGATSYELSRRAGNTWNVLATQAGTGYTDNALSGADTHVYRVRALDGASASGYAIDVATRVQFSTVEAGMTVLAGHISEVQSAINALRQAAGLSATELPIVNVGTMILASHITTARTAVAEARTALGIPVTFTDETLSTIRAIHVQELQGALR